MKTSIVIPYIVPQNGGEELRYALRSIEKNLDFDTKVYIIGEKPEWLTDKATFIPTERVNGMDYMVFLDTTSKIYLVSKDKRISQNFVYMYDDTFFINKTSLEDIQELKCLENMKDIPSDKWFKTSRASGKWKSLMRKTLAKLQDGGYSIYNFETHCPRVINKKKAKEVIEVNNMLIDPLMFSTLYYNVTKELGEIPRSLVPWGDGIKLGVYRPFDFETLKGKVKENKFLNYDTTSYNEGMKKLLEHLFAEKSGFEA
jgi:hypothetical protein